VSREELVVSQGSDTELNRGFVRRISTGDLEKAEHAASHASHGHEGGENGHGGHGGGHGEGHHSDRTSVGPRPEPLQMYKQMEHVLYRWGMTVDVSSCTGCSACVAACYAENNVSVVGKELFAQGREMSWIRIERYFDGPENEPVTGFLPMMCQHCGNAPCEPVCPVYATYHSDEGLNTMVYNRCVGTRYCSNNCSYKVRRFNWFEYTAPEPLNWQLNPDITVRGVGVMEKCTFCIQRIREAQNVAKNEGRVVKDGEILPACASSCPADCIRFGNLHDSESQVAKDTHSQRSYKILDSDLNTQPAITYLAKVTPGESKH
jgi:molybdopterin-containing oxidoreductase family iron-sulfur binding subunit